MSTATRGQKISNVVNIVTYNQFNSLNQIKLLAASRIMMLITMAKI
jgi:hypothetical protein